MFSQSFFSSFAFFALLFPLQGVAQDAIPRDATLPAKHAEIIEEYCLDCHDAFTEEAEVNLEDLNYNLAHDIQTAELWQKVLNVLNSGEMPPEKEKQIPDSAKASLLDDLSSNIVIARSILGDSGGVIPLRRLNRREYQNTLQDLIGVIPDVSNLPDDQAATEFDTMGGSLYFSSDQLESYLSTAKRALNLATKRNPSRPSRIIRLEPEDEWNKTYTQYHQEQLDVRAQAQQWMDNGKTEQAAIKAGFLDSYQARKLLRQYNEYAPQLAHYLKDPVHKTGVSLILANKKGYTRVRTPGIPFHEPGRYIIRVKAAHYPETPSRFHYIEYIHTNGSNTNRLGWKKVKGTFQDPEIVEFTTDYQPGGRRNFVLHQRSHQDRADKNIWVHDQRKNNIGTLPGVWIDWVELEGPLPETSTSFLIQLLKEYKRTPNKKQVEEILKAFAKRAFRGQEAQQPYINKLLARYETYRTQKQKHEIALNNTLAIILTSPKFLYLVEESSDHTGDKELLSDYELATRLSYFLTSSPPDDLLLAAAENGQLSEPNYLREHTERLLSSEKNQRFVESFSHQWLEMHRLDMFQFNGVHYPEFDNAIRENARKEIYAMMNHQLKEQRPLKELLKADYVIINDILADYYGIEGVKGSHFRKVSLPENSPRGGILGTAAFHVMGSDGDRSSPVERGVWVLRHLLNTPPPPAPPNVPQLSRLEGQRLTPQQLQQAHQEEPQCAQCHRKIDPIGYGLENFDATGTWRVQDAFYKRSKRGYGARDVAEHFPVKAQGELLDGTHFSSFFELRDIVASHSDAFAHKLVEGLVSYGLGRPYGFTDHDLAQEILTKARPHGYTVSECIHALVASEAFQSR